MKHDNFELKVIIEEREGKLGDYWDEVEESSNGETYHDLSCEVIINGSVVKHYTDIFAFFESVLVNGDCQPDWADKEQRGKYARFYPFTCSCGHAGCASIWEGIFTKHRKYSIEWRIKDKEQNGYDFIPKAFYSFDKVDYLTQIKNAWDTIVNALESHKALPENRQGFDSQTISQIEWIKDYPTFKQSILNSGS
jgi:hypothetical protein